MRKFVSLSKSEDRHWFVPMGTVEALFELVHDHYEKMVDKPAFLYQLYMEGVVGVGVTLHDLTVDEFRLFAHIMSDIYDAMLIDSAKQPYTGADSVYDVGVLVLLLSGDPRSVDYGHDPVLHKIGPDAYYSIPLAISRLIWSYVTAFIHEKNLQILAETLYPKVLQIKQGVDLTTMDQGLLSEIEGALYNLKFVQRGYSNVGDPMRQSACDPYIDELIVIISNLRAAFNAETSGGAKGKRDRSAFPRPLSAKLLREASAELDAEIKRHHHRILWSERERLFWEALSRLRHTPEPESDPENPDEAPANHPDNSDL